MASFGRQFSAASPVLTMSPQPSHRTPFAMGGFAPHRHAPPHPFGPVSYQTPPANTQRLPSTAGRKRSRDEASINLEPEAPPPVRVDEDQWVYGEGMVLIKPGPRYVADASSQSGTWLEETHAAQSEAARRQREEAQLDSRSHKAQRMGRDKAHASPMAVAVDASVDSSRDPIVDDFTLHLGIGWRRISDDEHIQAAARGWARFIENHFPLSNVSMRLESKGLQSYLVEASEGFFLFAESLRQGQLVSSTVDGALRNLQSTPPKFDSSALLVAAESPRSTPEGLGEVSPTDADMRMD